MKRRNTFSIVSRGANMQFILAATLITIIPLLVSIFILSPFSTEFALGRNVVLCIKICGILLALLGYTLLLKYPINITRLRRFLENLAEGNLPDIDTVALIKDEDDMAAIEDYAVTIIKQTDQRIKLIQRQDDDLLQAETQRVMIESLGAACHHLGQPATVLNVCLDMLSKHDLPEETKDLIAECQQSTEKIGHILDKLQAVTQFRSEPYRPLDDGDTPRSDEDILDIT